MAQVNYQPWAMTGLTHVFATHTSAAATPAAYSIRWFDAFEAVSQPFTQELPHAIMDTIDCRRPDVLHRGEVSALRQDCAAAALPAGDGDLESSLGRH